MCCGMSDPGLIKNGLKCYLMRERNNSDLKMGKICQPARDRKPL